jgi:hypothetical protein
MFNALNKISYKTYLLSNPFFLDIGISRAEVESLTEKELRTKIKKGVYDSVIPNVTNPKIAELDDLIRLHFLVTSRKITTILEFGLGVSTKVLDHAIQSNKQKFSNYVSENLRRSNAFEVHSVDNSKIWIKKTKKKYNLACTSIHFSKCYMGKFNDRICTYYSKLPNISPDFIYLDGPDQHTVSGDIHGISTRNMDRLPMAADLLAIEHFLLPGTLVVIDGRTANARFLQSNLQRNWKCQYIKEFDQHFFELDEAPLGKINGLQIKFSKSSSYF